MLPLRLHLPANRALRLLSLFTRFDSRQTVAFSVESKVRSVAMAPYSTADTEGSRRLLFRQLFEKESSTYTYLLADMGHPEKPAVLNEGKYVLVKDPMKPHVRIYEVPADAFENDYMEEPLPEEEQVRPPVEDEVSDGIVEAGAEGEVTSVGDYAGEEEQVRLPVEDEVPYGKAEAGAQRKFIDGEVLANNDISASAA